MQVCAVIGVAMADQHGIHGFSRRSFQQSWQGRVPRIDQQQEAIVFDEVTATRLTRPWPGATSAEHDDPHGFSLETGTQFPARVQEDVIRTRRLTWNRVRRVRR
jgi:hypothetical protein